MMVDEPDDDDPILSVVNLIDVLLVVVAALLLAMNQSPLRAFSQDDYTLIRNPGQANMEVIMKAGQEVKRYQAGEGAGSGQGVKAGLLYRMPDGSMVYVPE